jgi:hypothetical protein
MATANASNVDVELDQLRALGRSGRAAALRAMRAPGPIATLDAERTPKSYKCPVCGAELPDLPMHVLKHQMSHAGRRPFASNRQAGKH